MSEIIDGRLLREQILAELKERIEKEKLNPKLAVIQVGDNPESSRYIEQKRKAVEKIGASLVLFHLEDTVTFLQVKKLIGRLNRDRTICGIIVQLPLPKHLDEEKVVEIVEMDKDVDGFRKGSPFSPATPAAVLEILKREKVDLAGKVVVVVGRGKLVGRPLYEILSKDKTLGKLIQVHTQVPEPLTFYTKQADVLITATGQPNLIKAKMVKQGALVIDVGLSVGEEGKLSGDVDFKAVAKVASKITPVPGGVGPVTVAMLLENLVEAAKSQLT